MNQRNAPKTDPTVPETAPAEEERVEHVTRPGTWLAWWRRPPSASREKVGLWLGLLLLFAPVFYVLLYLKSYSLKARVVWGLWLGLIVFVKVMGLAEPVIDIRPEVRTASRGPVLAEPDVPIGTYLRRLEGGFLGMFVEDYAEEQGGRVIHVRFRQADDYFVDKESVALAGIATGFNLLYGRGYEGVVMELNLRNRPLRISLDRPRFRTFFGLSETQMQALAADRKRFDASPVKSPSLDAQRRFFRAFATYP